MSGDDVTIERGLPEELRHDAAVVFDQAFGAKLGLGIRDATKRLALVEDALTAGNLIVAKVGDDLAGIVGLATRGGRYAGGSMSDEVLSLRSLWHRLGFLRAVWAKIFVLPFQTTPPEDALYLAEIAVAEVARGRGIGARLLDEVAAIAREEGKARVQLDVIDTNPRAQALYERHGYVVSKTYRFGVLRRFLGFGGIISMDLPIEQADVRDEPADPQDRA